VGTFSASDSDGSWGRFHPDPWPSMTQTPDSLVQHLHNTSTTRGPRGPWVAHLRIRSKVTVEPIIENPRGII